MPNSWDLLTWSPVRNLIEEDACAIAVTEERWQPVLDLVLRDGYIESYRAKVLEDCNAKLVAACPDAREDIRQGLLPTTLAYAIVTELKGLDEIITWGVDELLSNVLLARAKTKYIYSPPDKWSQDPISFSKDVWDAEKLSFDAINVRAARFLLSDCGMPMQTPVSEVLEYGKTLKCARCPAGCSDLMTWVEIVSPLLSLNHYHSSRFQVRHFAGENKSHGRAMMFRKEKFGSL